MNAAPLSLAACGDQIPKAVIAWLTDVLPVSRETCDALLAYDALFLDHARRHNLVARSTLPDRWHRHFLDSAQLMPLIPREARHLVDFGSGGGFPGLVLAILATDPAVRAIGTPPLHVTLIESTGKKAAFLRATTAALGLSHVCVENERIEHVANRVGKADVITARAIAGLEELLAMSVAFMTDATTLVFPKGARADTEIETAQKNWRFSFVCHPSVTDGAARILEITQLCRHTANHPDR